MAPQPDIRAKFKTRPAGLLARIAERDPRALPVVTPEWVRLALLGRLPVKELAK